MSQQKVRVAVVGLGAWGECHVAAYDSLPEVEIVAVCDTRTERVQELADQYGIAGRYENHEDLWRRDDIDLVNIVTIETDHLKPVLSALRSGKHVLVEKPVSLHAAEAREMRQAAQESGKFLVPGHILRFDARYAQAKQAIATGKIGEVASIFSKRARAKWQFPIYGRVHPVYVSMAHDLDLAIWYAGGSQGGGRVKAVRAWHKQVNPGPNPDLLWAHLDFASGAFAVLQSNWLVPDQVLSGRADSAEILGSDGLLTIDTDESGFEIWNAEGRQTPDFAVHEIIGPQVRGAHREQLRYLAECVGANRQPDYVSFDDAVHGIEVAEAILESAKNGQEVRL